MPSTLRPLAAVLLLLNALPAYAQSKAGEQPSSGVRCTRLSRQAGLPSKPVRAASPAPGVAAPRPGTRCERLRYGPEGMLPNRPPQISLVPLANSIRTGPNSMVLGVIAADPDDDSMLYTWTPTGGTLSGDGARIAWDLNAAAPGSHRVTVEVDDGCGCVAWASSEVLSGPVTLPTPRWGASVAEANGVIYVSGGYNSLSGGHLTVFEAFDVAGNTFSTKAPPPDIQTAAIAGEINGVVYFAGGSDCCTKTSTLTAYNIASNRWLSKPTPLSPHGNGPAGGAIYGLFYVAGGTSVDGSTSHGVLEEYDPATNGWRLRAPMPTPRHEAGSAVIDGILYVVGGRTGVGDTLRILGTVEAYDPDTNVWSLKAPLPTPRSDLVVGVIDGMVYAAGGFTATGAVAVVEAYDPETNKWMAMPSLPVARAGARGTVVNDVLYLFGGYTKADVALNTIGTVATGKR